MKRSSRWSSISSSIAVALIAVTSLTAQPSRAPRARLIPASRITLPGDVDSSNPAIWSLVDGARRLFVFSSWGGIPTRSSGPAVNALSLDGPVGFGRHPGHGVWIESIVPDSVGTLYAYYHHERAADLCGRPDRQLPSIGALRSLDGGLTWDDLGIILDAPAGSEACNSMNRFVLGGVGDVTAVLEPDSRDLYLYFSQYSRDPSVQGVAVARLAWADRDRPAGKVMVWRDGAWLPDSGRSGTPLVRASQPFHDAAIGSDVFWGPSIHWNTYLNQYVMLLNRARNDHFDQDGIYVSYSQTLSDPAKWTPPMKIMHGGTWYPQVIGTEAGTGTDRRAGKRARFFMTGRSDRVIDFER